MKSFIRLPIIRIMLPVLTAGHSAAQSTYEPYTFTNLADYGSADETGPPPDSVTHPA